MVIKLNESMNFNEFNNEFLSKLKYYADYKINEDLIIDFQTTTFISPSVMCDLLSIINVIKHDACGKIKYRFGNNTPLISFLNNTNFFMGNLGQDIETDVVDFSGEYAFLTPSNEIKKKKKKENTDIIQRINLPTDKRVHEGETIYCEKWKSVDQAKEEINMKVQQAFIEFYTKKREAISKIGLDDICCGSLMNAYSEILKNSYFHGGHSHSFYTFQNYSRSGLSFVCSDTGMGYYRSFIEKIKEKKKGKGLFDDEEFKKASGDLRVRSLMGIVEGVLYRFYNPKKIFDHGIMDIIKIVLGVGRNNNAILRIQSDYAMLQFDAFSLPLLFSGVTDEDVKKPYYDLIPREDMFFGLVTEDRIRRIWETSGHIVYSDYCFPGVHISATIDSEKRGDR